MKIIILSDEQLTMVAGSTFFFNPSQNVNLKFALDANILTGNANPQNTLGTGGDGGQPSSQFLAPGENGILDATVGNAILLSSFFTTSVSIKIKQVPISFPKTSK